MTEWNCMDPDYPDRLCDYEDCEVECPYRKAREKLRVIRKLLGRQPYNDIRIDFKDKLKEIMEAEE